MTTSADRPTASSTRDPQAHRLEADGHWCPMAHSNRNVNSFQEIQPLLQVRHVQKVTDPDVSPWAAYHLGAFTGETMAVCVYASPTHPALVAYDYHDASVRWTSPVQDLQASARRREVAAVLLARLRGGGHDSSLYVFAANPSEFVAYSDAGRRLWKRSSREITPEAPNGIGGPISLTFDDHALITATDAGWIVKIDPQDGRMLDAYRMDTSITVDRRLIAGTFVSLKSIALVGTTVYLAAEFNLQGRNQLLPRALTPVYVLRIDLGRRSDRRPGTWIAPLDSLTRPGSATADRIQIGVNTVGGSPSTWRTPEGTVLIFANSQVLVGQQLKPIVMAIEDEQGTLSVRWQSILDAAPGDRIYSAPGFHEASRTLVVSTARSMYLFRGVDSLVGNIPSPASLSANELVGSIADQIGDAGVGSPLALAFDEDAGEIIVYTSFRLLPVWGRRSYGFLGAFSLPADRRGVPRLLWHFPLSLAPNGLPAPGPGTFGQPALFRVEEGTGGSTGLVVNTVRSGTYFVR